MKEKLYPNKKKEGKYNKKGEVGGESCVTKGI